MERHTVDVVGLASVFGERNGSEGYLVELWLERFCNRVFVVGSEIMIVPHSRPTIDQEDIRAVAEVLASGMIAQGEKVREFENAIAGFVGMKYGVAVSSGTSALHLALLGLGVGPGDEVIMPSYVCSSPYFATLHAGAKPRIADIGIDDFNICAETAKKRLSKRTGAIIVPHMFGTAAELDGLVELGVPVVEDCAQALGAEYKGKKTGGIGDVGVLSFYATKMITTGEGGMVLTNSAECREKVLEVRDYDKKSLGKVRYNYKMTDFQGAFGLSQLAKLDSFIHRRIKIAHCYSEALSASEAIIPQLLNYKKSVFFRYVILIDRALKVRREAKKLGVGLERPVFQPLHKYTTVADCPHTNKVYTHALSIPIYPGLSDAEVDFVVDKLTHLC
jgi:dTDP-4-amino-4,6-dideoxygalactose transaminase